MKKHYHLFGIVAPSLYIATVILGGFLQRDYSHTDQAISELTTSGAPYALQLNVLFTISGIMATIFAWSAYFYVSKFNSRLLKLAMGTLITVTLVSLVWPLFPMDARGAEQTAHGIIHLALAGIVSPLTILCPALTAVGFMQIEGFKGYVIASFIFSSIILITGILAVHSTQIGAANLGIYTRLTIGTYQLWMAYSAAVFYCFPHNTTGKV
ncbi:MAG: DUF998 domain-containing protein [Firmicutes bacterium]|nr:DUF998 domain-containing protein [Bacillota bacterium]